MEANLVLEHMVVLVEKVEKDLLGWYFDSSPIHRTGITLRSLLSTSTRLADGIWPVTGTTPLPSSRHFIICDRI